MPLDNLETTSFLERRIEVERELGTRSFIDFYKMAWPYMDPEPFIDGKHIRVICYHLQCAARREIPRLVICIPPRYSKSLMTSVAFPAWVWTWWPEAKFITASYGLQLATRDALATRRLVESRWYQERWDTRLVRDMNLKTHYQTTVGGVRFVGSPGTGVTGHGSDFNVLDDPHDITSGDSDPERKRAIIFWFETMSGRFNNPERGVSIVVQQRVHSKDVAGECIRRGYYSVVLPARFEPDHPQRHEYDWRTKPGEPLWPEKFSTGVLDGLWTVLGGADGYAVAGQQQQRPQPREGGLFKREWFATIEAIPAGTIWVRAWDLASTEEMGSNDPDWTVGCKFGYHPPTKTFIIGHILRDRVDPGGVEQMIINTAMQDGKGVPIFIPQDPAQAGKMQVKYLTQQLAGYNVKFEPATGSKSLRASPLAAQAKVGNVKLYRADWNEPFLEEITAFPTGGHDDQVDASASGFTMFVGGDMGLYDFLKEQARASLQDQEDLKRAMGLVQIVDYQTVSGR
jgi:predicted phage terminase large subunit-like protein